MQESVEIILAQHLALCEETYQVLLEENRILKQTSQPPDQEFLRRKERILPRFDLSHRGLREADRAETRQFRQTIEKAQQLVMKTLRLDRENEQLLLKCTLGRRPRVMSAAAPSLGWVQRTCGKATVSEGELVGAGAAEDDCLPLERRQITDSYNS